MSLKDAFAMHCRGTQLKFIVLPKRCYITGRLMFLEYAYKQTAMWPGLDDSVFEYRYYDKHQFLVERLKESL